MISATLVAANTYEVVVEAQTQTSTQTKHRVHMSQEYYRELCGATVTHEYVLISAFKFLLEREPNTMILAEFDLTDINRYFPEFEEEIKARLNR